ncbi:MAG: protein translocase subunit SecF [Chloroflexota bacterium]
MFDFTGKRLWFFILSAAIIVVGVIFLVAAGSPLGIDFTGGVMMTVKFEEPVTHETLESTFADLGHDEAIVQETGEENTFLIRTKELGDEERSEVIDELEKLGMTSQPSLDYVSDPVAEEKVRGAAIAVAIAAIGILLYISYAFRKLPNPFRYGTCAIIALVHDVLIAVAVFAIVGQYFNLEINLMFVTGLLTVIGYSVNDTIVVFDRIRENLGKDTRQGFVSVVNTSLMETLSRSFNTSLTTLVVLIAIYLFVGAAINSFVFVLIVGLISGTYSSIFIASQALVVWQTRKLGKLSGQES